MHKIYFYKDSRGKEPVRDYIQTLAKRNDKDSRIKANKILDYMEYLQKEGFESGEPYIKHLKNEIWELRPLKDRILFASWQVDGFVFLHHFVKKTKKTPLREITQAKKNLKKYKELSQSG